MNSHGDGQAAELVTRLEAHRAAGMVTARCALSAEQLERLLELKYAAWDAMPDVGPGDPADLARFVTVCEVFRILGIDGDRPPPAGIWGGPAAADPSIVRINDADSVIREGEAADATLWPGGRHRGTRARGGRRWRHGDHVYSRRAELADVDGDGAGPGAVAGRLARLFDRRSARAPRRKNE